jgi:protein-glutamine gamma-glutamyltransferase
MAVATFVLMEMRRSAHSASVEARTLIGARQRGQFAKWLLRLAPALMLIILCFSGAIFFVLPRMSGGYLGAYSFGTDFSTGFSDHVQLGQIGRIQQSNAVVMHIQIDGDADGRHDLYWRGTALRVFDGRSWSTSGQQFPLEKQANNEFEIPPFGTGALGDSSTTSSFSSLSTFSSLSSLSHPSSLRRPGKIVRYRVLMEPIGTNVFFLAPWARRVSGNYRLLSADSGAAVHDLDSEHPIASYEAESDISQPSAEELRAAGSDYPAQVVHGYLQLPVVDPRVRSLVLEITAASGNNFNKAASVERYLKTHYGYTLQLPGGPVKDPLANFLFERRQGHCEYFASAMTVMLRTLGIPARVVNGFRSDEFNDLTGNYVVRAKDAHAWVEAYFPGYGWQTFDPTPAGKVGTPEGWGRIALYVDAAASFWREWVVGYDSSHQYVLGQTAVIETHNAWERLQNAARRKYGAMLQWTRRRQKHIERSPGRWIGIAFAVALALIGLRFVEQFIRWAREKWVALSPSKEPEQAAAMWYARMSRSLARRGEAKDAAQTPDEFVSQIADDQLRARVEEFTVAYQSARFGSSADDAERLPELYEEVESAAKK